VRIDGQDTTGMVAEAADFDELERELAQLLIPETSAVVNFFTVPTGDSFDVQPETAMKFFRAKGLRPTFSYADMLGAEHDHAFTVAKMMDVDLLGQVRASLDEAMAQGVPFQAWADDLVPQLQQAGWWGRKEMRDPVTGRVIIAQAGSPWRLETIFRTNMQSSYAAGQWSEIEAQAGVAPYLMYDAVDDDRTRDEHRAWDKLVLPVTHPFWADHYPPNGYNCRCGVIQLSRDDVAQLGLDPAPSPPREPREDWRNPRTGEVTRVAKGIDPGFDHNAGLAMAAKLKRLLAEKVAALPPSMKAAVARAPVDATITATAIQRQSDQAGQAMTAQAARPGTRAQRTRAAREAQAAANRAIQEIKEGKAGATMSDALAAVSRAPDWNELLPTEQLERIVARASLLDRPAG
jgi:SPP1 gp7 family putative phage head morphogenesis protein